MNFFVSLAAQAAIAIDNAALFSDLQRSNAELILAYDTTIEGWARALELRDQETEGHTKRATEMTLRLALAMGMNDAELVHVRRRCCTISVNEHPGQHPQERPAHRRVAIMRRHLSMPDVVPGISTQVVPTSPTAITTGRHDTAIGRADPCSKNLLLADLWTPRSRPAVSCRVAGKSDQEYIRSSPEPSRSARGLGS
jgi:hypothetical protein